MQSMHMIFKQITTNSFRSYHVDQSAQDVNRRLSLIALEAGSRRSRCQQILFLVRIFFLVCIWLPPLCSQRAKSQSALVSLPLLRTLILPDQGPILMTLPNLNYLSKASSSNIWLWVRTSTYKFRGTQFSSQLMHLKLRCTSIPWCTFTLEVQV